MAASSGGAKKPAGAKKTASNSRSKASAKRPAPRPVRREAGAVVCAFLGIFSLIGYFDVQALFIDVFCGFIKGLLGWGYFLFPIALLASAFILATHRGRPVALRVTSAMLLPLMIGAAAHMLFAGEGFAFGGSFIDLCERLYVSGTKLASGGLLAGLASMALEAMFSVYGAVPVLLVIMAALCMCIGRVTPAKLAARWRGRGRAEYEAYEEPEPEPEKPRRGRRAEDEAKQPARRPARRSVSIDVPMDDEPGEEDEYYERFREYTPPAPARAERRDRPADSTPIPVSTVYTPHPEVERPAPKPKMTGFKPEPAPEYEPAPRFEEPEPVFTSISEPIPSPAAAPDEPEEELRSEIGRTVREIRAEKPKPDENVNAEMAAAIEKGAAETPEYEFPPIDLLRRSSAAAPDGREEISLNRERLASSLKSFGVAARIVGATRGPTVTRYDLELESGVKLTKLTNLANDLALSLGVMNVRIAPIPDKISTVGIEVPNKIVSIVYLREVIESPEFRNAKSTLTFAIGKDISGKCVVGNIAKLPHMLIAGTTGSGKSVCLNSLLLSLLYKATPEQVRLIMIDPKMVELGIYNGIPHLYVPVVTDPKKAAGALQWAVVEMLKRYRLFSECGVRDLAGYNAHQKKTGGETMPQVVIVVDELADLMLVASKDVEESICRVAQMGRAAGMHLIIATQRPSADVITGLMKANIPSRIAFAVSSAMESRIILDAAGAEKLIGMGDMLYSPLGSGKPMRVQGAFVSDEEREDVIDHIKGSSQAEYSDEVLHEIEKAAQEKDKPKKGEKAADEDGFDADAGENNAFADYDELLPQAVDVIFDTKQASVSMLQRRLKLGYSRAARLVDQMEELGIVGPFEGSKPRQVLITKQQWQEMQLINGSAPTERSRLEAEFGTDAPEDME